MNWLLGRIVAISCCGALVGKTRITNLDFGEDAIILAESMDDLRSIFLSLSKEAKQLGPRVS